MNKELEDKLIEIARKRYDSSDPCHDFLHSKRVYELAKKIGIVEGADLDIVIPAALFHDLIVYVKHSDKHHLSTVESAEEAKKILIELRDFPAEKIDKVYAAIVATDKRSPAMDLEARVVKDADNIDATGAFGIARTFAYSTVMKIPFYDENDILAEKREYDEKSYALDHFSQSLLKFQDQVETATAKKITKRRSEFMKLFIDEFKKEIDGE